MNSKVILISGTDYDINGIQKLGEFNTDSNAEVVKFNKFGYVGIKVKGRDGIVKRHLSDCEDIRSMLIGSAVKNLAFENNRWTIIHKGDELISEDVYVVKLQNRYCGEHYISRSNVEGYVTDDITKAWFTFEREQAVGYANKMSIKRLMVYTAVKVEDAIKLEHYE